jgi:hypothetical protein
MWMPTIEWVECKQVAGALEVENCWKERVGKLRRVDVKDRRKGFIRRNGAPLFETRDEAIRYAQALLAVSR